MQKSFDNIIKIDLGCGISKEDGFIGVDRFKMKGVDVIADLDKRLPFSNDSIDLVYASHSLEHVKDIIYTMKELSRICKHKAQLAIVAPYYNQSLNIANPYHLTPFNEHSSRFWTNYRQNKYIDNKIWFHHTAISWGLQDSDCSNSDLDIRCVNMEFFYFKEYRYLSENKKFEERKRKMDVCDQIMMHCIVLKKEISDKEFDEVVDNMSFFVPEYIKLRKKEEKRKGIFFKKYI